MNQDELEGGAPASAIMVEVGGQRFPMKSVSNCRTCQSPYRLEIEQAICAGASYASAADVPAGRAPGRLAHPTAANIRYHVDNKHMPLGATMQHLLIVDRAKEIGRSIEDSSTSLVDYVATNRAIIQKGMDRISTGELQPNMSELLTAIRIEHQVQAASGDGLDTEAWQGALIAYMEVATAFIPQERLGEYGRALAKHPILRALVTGEVQVLQGSLEP